MRGPVHHPPEELLFEYATGSTNEAVGMLVATHCALCPQCRGDVEEMELLGGAMLTGGDPVASDKSMLDGLLAKLDDIALDPHPPAPEPGSTVFPEPLRSYLPSPEPTALPWKPVLRGYKQVELPLSLGTGVPVRLAHFSPNFVIPNHTHGGRELAMVLTGGYKDGDRQYLRGDVGDNGADRTHSIHVDEDEHCIALLVSESYVKPRSFGIWLATWLAKSRF